MPRTTVLAVILLGAVSVLVTGCDREPPMVPTPPPAAPAAPPAPPAGSGSTLTGTVVAFSETGRVGPVPNLRLQVHTNRTRDGFAGSTVLTEVTTDEDGRYEIRDVNATLLFFSTAPGSSHRFLCEGYPVLSWPPFTFRATDLPVVSSSWAGDRLPDGIGVIGTSIHGRVIERVNGNPRPVSGAVVAFDTESLDPPATTNDAGFYMICSVVGTDTVRTATASRNGYEPAAREFLGGWDSKIDFELFRN